MIRTISAILLAFGLISGAAGLPRANALGRASDVLPKARFFTLKIHGNKIHGAELGPKSGPSVLIVPGFSADYPYLSPLVTRLATLGCRVFIYNPQGQGSDDRRSTGPSKTLGMSGLVQTVTDMHKYIRQLNGQQPVTWVGHSMGGMEIRFASLVTPANEVQALIPLFSPSIVYAKPDLSSPVLAYQKLLNEQIFTDDLINAWTLGAYDFWKLESAEVMFVNEQNGLLRGLLGAPNPNAAELKANVAYFLDWKASPEIISDIENIAFPDLIRAWSAVDLSKTEIISMTGDNDGVISSADSVREARELGYPNVRVPTGHIGAFYDVKITPRLANLVAQIAEGTLNRDQLAAQAANLEEDLDPETAAVVK